MNDIGFRVALAALGSAAGRLAAIPHAESADELADAADALRDQAERLSLTTYSLSPGEGLTVLALVEGALAVVRASMQAVEATPRDAETKRRLSHLLRAVGPLAAAARAVGSLTPPAKVQPALRIRVA
jgi:hypothetical protein